MLQKFGIVPFAAVPNLLTLTLHRLAGVPKILTKDKDIKKR